MAESSFIKRVRSEEDIIREMLARNLSSAIEGNLKNLSAFVDKMESLVSLGTELRAPEGKINVSPDKLRQSIGEGRFADLQLLATEGRKFLESIGYVRASEKQSTVIGDGGHVSEHHAGAAAMVQPFSTAAPGGGPPLEGAIISPVRTRGHDDEA